MLTFIKLCVIVKKEGGGLMKVLQERIQKDGIVKSSELLKVDSFLNHQIDVKLVDEIGQELYRRFADKKITKVLTIETSGIAIGYAVARLFGVPLVFAKKKRSINIDGDLYIAEIPPSTKKSASQVIIYKKFLSAGDSVLIVDDILANGGSLQGLVSLVESAEAAVAGLGIVIEKGFQEGGHRLRNLGYHLESLVVIEDMDPRNGVITFREQNI